MLATYFLSDFVPECAIHVLLRADHLPMRAMNAFEIAIGRVFNDELRRESMLDEAVFDGLQLLPSRGVLKMILQQCMVVHGNAKPLSLSSRRANQRLD